ncbi:hypothetical protein [Microvirga aerophila]|uniref:Uncharacterized protein n=1 Tax=Microvirga aerophila TaxID=670291 RepID=A0A512C5G8_9HYPH|nr:hypothetical protein [Microvirga aerophila]GEO19466.1 hypothetical protein MAE02_71620 [Microvirga aerophila]
MRHNSFTETINERLTAIELVVVRIARAGDQSDLPDLRVLLIDVMGLLKRNPGVEAAADDLYAAAAAVAMDTHEDWQPATRKRRLLTDASLRFCGRTRRAAEEGEPEDRLILRGIAAMYAAQVAHRATSIEIKSSLSR